MKYCGAELTGASIGEVLKTCGSTLKRLSLITTYSVFNGLSKAIPKDFKFKSLEYLNLSLVFHFILFIIFFKKTFLFFFQVSNTSKILSLFFDKYNAAENLKSLVVKDSKFFYALCGMVLSCKKLEEFDFGPEYSEKKNWKNCYIENQNFTALINSFNPDLQILKIPSPYTQFFNEIAKKLKNLRTLHFHV